MIWQPDSSLQVFGKIDYKECKVLQKTNNRHAQLQPFEILLGRRAGGALDPRCEACCTYPSLRCRRRSESLSINSAMICFERRGRGLVLTEVGQIAFEHANEIFSTGEQLLRRLNRDVEDVRHVLRVGALATLSRNFQISFLRPVLGSKHVEIVLRSGSLVELLGALEAHRLDVVLVNQIPLRDSATNWTAHIIDQQEVSIVGTQARVGQNRDMIKLLNEHPIILPTADVGFRNGFDALVERLNIQPEIIAEVDDMAMMRVLAREDIGLAVLPPIVVTDELTNGRLIEACKLPNIQESFAALTLKQRFPNPALGTLLEGAGG
jgi:LysR family transcriptional activator of nhaA